MKKTIFSYCDVHICYSGKPCLQFYSQMIGFKSKINCGAEKELKGNISTLNV